VGCPVGLYQANTHELLCPCHQSTFAVLDGARPRFGPATRSLPQLALSVDGRGFLVAQGDFEEPVGPGFWNRG
jgi:ubiquinol-cytochrome c reductase iron-sulfur subunit